MTTGLLVSVRSAEEAREALAGGAWVIDIKEPLNGALGAASLTVWDEVRRAVAAAAGAVVGGDGCAQVLLSAALGELLELRDHAFAAELHGFAFAKIGLAGCREQADWEERWNCWVAELPPGCAPVAVVYADHVQARAPAPPEVLRAARNTRTRTLLIDTSDKTQGDLWHWLEDRELSALLDLARAAGFRVALAGSLGLDTLARALRFAPDWVAVRGAVCRAGRDSRVERDRVNHFATRLSTPGVLNQISISAR